MLTNYLHIAFRNMTRNMRFTILHISGLCIGLASVILLTWYIYDEISYDQLPQSDQVFRINTYWGDDPKTDIYATTPPPLADAIESEIPEVEKVARAFTWNHSTMRLPAEETAGKDEVVFRETRIFIVDPAFLEVMQYPMIDGDSKSAFDRHESIVITKKTALRYFGKKALDNHQVIGKSILFGGDRTARIVTGVVNPPENTHFHFDMLVNINFGYTELDTIKQWAWNIMHTYVKVNAAVAKDQGKLNALQSKLTAIGARNLSSAEGESGQVKSADFRLQPVKDIHLHSHFQRELEPNGDYSTVQLLATVAVLILLLACANFINLFTAQSARRAKEVGVRKTLGSGKGALATQFFVESALYTLIATLLALSLAELLRVPFNAVSGKNLKFSWLDNPILVLCLFIGFLLTAFFSGSYPSLFLASFNPVRALKGSLARQKNHLRNGLVIFQFSISIGLMICSVFILQQLLFMENRAPGYDKENVVVVQNDREIREKWRTFRDVLEVKPSIAKVSFNTGMPTQPLNVMRDFRRPGEASGLGINVFLIDENYMQALGLTLQSGSNFSDNPTNNTHKIMVNETAARMLGLSQPIGQQLVLNYGAREEEKVEVVAVIKDFNVESLHTDVKPLVFYYYFPDFSIDFISVRLKAGNPSEGLKEIEQAWKTFEPENPFVYSFLDKDFEQFYIAEQRLGRLFGGFTILTVLIALLGLTGLASFMAEQRTKEIGIRKVLGASVGGIMVLFSKDFTRLAVMAMVIAIPTAYYVMDIWLNEFVYRIHLNPAVFIICSLAALILMWATVSLLSLRVAKLDPAKTLKIE